MSEMYERLYFIKYLRKMRTSMTPDHDFNHLPWQSRIVIGELFAYAEENPQEIKLFIGDVNAEFFKASLFDKIKELLQKGCTFDIVLAKPPSADRRNIWEDIVAFGDGNVHVRYKETYNDDLCHLVLIGDSYRFELPHPELAEEVTETTPERKAQFGFHERSTSKEILSYWEESVNAEDLVPILAA